MYIYIYVYICIYIYIYVYRHRGAGTPPSSVRETGGPPRNPAPRNHLLIWIVKTSGCHSTDAFCGKKYRREPTPLRSTSPFSDSGALGESAAQAASSPKRRPPRPSLADAYLSCFFASSAPPLVDFF